MTTRTIPEYLEDEQQKNSDDQLRMAEEAARMRPLHHGRLHTAKQPKLELHSSLAAATKVRKTSAASRKKPRVARKAATKARKVA